MSRVLGRQPGVRQRVAPVVAMGRMEPRTLLASSPFYVEKALPGEVLSNLDCAEYAAASVLRDGKILTITIRDDSPRFSLVITRRNKNGKLDRTFGDGGSVVSTFRDGIILNHVRILPGGKLLVTGSIGEPALTSDGDDNILLMRLNSQGLPDPTFGDNGFATVSFGKNTYETGTYLDVGPDGRIVLSGRLDTHSADTAHAVYAAFTSDGLLDPSFGRAGRLRLSLSDLRVSTAGTLRFLPDGNLLLAATHRTPRKPRATFVLARLNPKGQYDKTFGRRGFAQLPNLWGDYTPESAILPDGKILLGQLQKTDQNADPTNEPALFLRLQSTGEIDPTFGLKGTLADPTLPSRLGLETTSIQPRINLLHPLPKGAFYVAARGPKNSLFARYTSQGFDSSFGTKGTATTPYDDRADSVNLILPQKDGKLLLAGVARHPEIFPDAAGWLARFTVKGKPDSRFGGVQYDRRRDTPELINVPGRLRVIGTDGDDEIHVVINGDTDTYSVKVNGEPLAAGVASHIFANGFSESVPGYGLSIDARRGDDTVNITSDIDVPVTVFGGAGADHLFGSRSRDLLVGDAGNDLLMGEGGDDTLAGNRGDDLLFGGEDDDTIYAQEGLDTAEGNRGENTVFDLPATDPRFR